MNKINKVLYLDGIRGFAAFMVFCHHFLLSFYSAHYFFTRELQHLPNDWELKYGQSVFSVLTNGNYFVNVFFVLSGLVLSRKYYRTNNFSDLVSGAHRRFLRLYIPIAFTIILVYILMLSGLFYNHEAGKFVKSQWCYENSFHFPDVGVQFIQALLYNALLNGDQTFNTTFWTMPIELYGSLFVFAFLALTHTIKNRKNMLILLVIFCFFSNSMNVAMFSVGISLNLIENKTLLANKYLNTLIALLILLAGLTIGSYPSNNSIKNTLFENMDPYMMNYAGWFHPVGAYLLVLSIVLSPALQKVFSMRIFAFLGYISFSLYLLHVPLISSFGSYLLIRTHNQIGYNQSVLLVFVTTAILLLFVSWLMTKYIDEGGVKLAHRVYERYIKKTAIVEEQKELE